MKINNNYQTLLVIASIYKKTDNSLKKKLLPDQAKLKIKYYSLPLYLTKINSIIEHNQLDNIIKAVILK